MSTITPASPYSKSRVREVAIAQKMLMYAILAIFIGRGGGFIGLLVAAGTHNAVLTGVYLVVYGLVILATLAFMLFAVLRVARSLAYSTAEKVLLFIGMFIPLVNLITLLALNGKATYRLRDAGVRVGFFGADLSRMSGPEAATEPS
jgi:hypothetical protein